LNVIHINANESFQAYDVFAVKEKHSKS